MAVERPLAYVIQCARMTRTERVFVADTIDLLRTIERYVIRFGELTLLYLEGRE